MAAYEEMIQATATKKAPWYIVPADDKWYARAVVGGCRHRNPRQPETQVSSGQRRNEEGTGEGASAIVGTKKRADQPANVTLAPLQWYSPVRSRNSPVAVGLRFRLQSPDHVSFSVDPPCGFLSCFLVPASVMLFAQTSKQPPERFTTCSSDAGTAKTEEVSPAQKKTGGSSFQRHAVSADRAVSRRQVVDRLRYRRRSYNLLFWRYRRWRVEVYRRRPHLDTGIRRPAVPRSAASPLLPRSRIRCTSAPAKPAFAQYLPR